jgi:hypothetical protein
MNINFMIPIFSFPLNPIGESGNPTPLIIIFIKTMISVHTPKAIPVP